MSDDQIRELLEHERRTIETASLVQALSVIVGAFHTKCPTELMTAYEYAKGIAANTAAGWYAAALRAKKDSP